MATTNEVRIKISSYDHRLLEKAVNDIIYEISKGNYTFKGPIPLPTDREIFTFQRSPHVDKMAMESFERLTHKRLLIINGDKSVLSIIDNVNIPAGVTLNIKN